MGHVEIHVHVCRLIPLQRVTSLRRSVQANTPAALYWLLRVLDWTSSSCKGASRRGRNLQCAIAMFSLRVSM